MAKKVVNLTIALKDKVSGGIRNMGSALNKFKQNLFSLPTLMKAAFASAPILALGKAIKTSFNFETMRTQLQVLTGSVESAATEFKRLRDFSARTPFQIEGIVEAYRNLKIFTGEALTSQKGLELVGDAAAATGKDFSEVSYWTGRLYSALKNGDPFMDSVSAMQRMGIVGGEIRGTLTRLSESGADFSTMWQVVEKDLNRFTGGMQMLSTTGNGLISTLKDNWTIAVATFGDAFMESAKGGIQTMIKHIKELVDNGTITKWAEQAKSALDAVIQTVKILTGTDTDAREKVVAGIINVIKAGFIDAGNAVVGILAKAMPLLGNALGVAAKAAISGGARGEAAGKLKESGQIEDIGFFESLFPTEETIAKSERNKAKVEAALSQLLDEQGNNIAKSYEGFGKHTKKAWDDLVRLNSSLEKNVVSSISGISRSVKSSVNNTSPASLDSSSPIVNRAQMVKDALAVIGKKPSQTSKEDDSFSSPVGMESATDLFSMLTNNARRGGGALGTEDALSAITDLIHGPSDKSNEILSKQNEILEKMYQLQSDRLGGISGG